MAERGLVFLLSDVSLWVLPDRRRGGRAKWRTDEDKRRSFFLFFSFYRDLTLAKMKTT